MIQYRCFKCGSFLADTRCTRCGLDITTDSFSFIFFNLGKDLLIIEKSILELSGKLVTNEKVSLSDGTTVLYTGRIKNGVPVNTDSGKCVFEDGSEYTGSIKDGNACGEGRLVNDKGFIYSGYFYNGKPISYRVQIKNRSKHYK